MKVFISYAHEDRTVAGQVKELMSQLGVQCFLAHEDLDVSDEWQKRICEELRTCDALVALLSRHFENSRWAPQEVGFIAVARRDVLIAPISLDGTRAFGFFGHLQSPNVPLNGVTREFLIVPLARRFPRAFLPGLIALAGRAGTFRDAEARMKPLVEFFGVLTADEVEALAAASVSNGQIWCAKECRDNYLPELLRSRPHDMSARTYRALKHQVEQQESYHDDSDATDDSAS